MRPILNVTLLTICLASLPLMATEPEPADTAPVLSINSPILALMDNEATRKVLEQHLPGLARAMQENYDAMEFLGSSTLRELQADSQHVIGFTEERLMLVLYVLQTALDGEG